MIKNDAGTQERRTQFEADRLPLAFGGVCGDHGGILWARTFYIRLSLEPTNKLRTPSLH